MICISGSLLNMTALVLHQDQTVDADGDGHYETKQDPISGALIKVWVPASVGANGGAYGVGGRIKCSASAILEGGIRVNATTEHFSPRGTLDVVDYIDFTFGPGDVVTRRDRITDIRNSKGQLIWKEEELGGKPTVFEVPGVVPITDPFGELIEQQILLQRAENQGGFWRDNEGVNLGS